MAYAQISEENYIRDFCNNNYSEYLEKSKGWRKDYIQTAYNEIHITYDDNLKIEIINRYYICD